MKKSTLVLTLVLAVVAVGLIFLIIEGQAQRGRGYYGYDRGPGPMMGGGGYGAQQYCPYCGSYVGPGGGYGMGPGMMGPGYGYGRGPGMMGPGHMMGRGYGYGPQYQQLEKPLGKKDAKEQLENYVQSMRNPDLKLGKVTEKDTYFEGEILTKKDVLVDTIIVDKNTGWMDSAMRGPGMKGRGSGYGYGMGPGMMGPGYGRGPGMMGPGYQGQGYGPRYGSQYQQPQKPLEEKDVKAMLEHYVQSTRNPNLKVGKITAKETSFEAEIRTKDNALVDTIIVDKQTGWMRSIY